MSNTLFNKLQLCVTHQHLHIQNYHKKMLNISLQLYNKRTKWWNFNYSGYKEGYFEKTLVSFW